MQLCDLAYSETYSDKLQMKAKICKRDIMARAEWVQRLLHVESANIKRFETTKEAGNREEFEKNYITPISEAELEKRIAALKPEAMAWIHDLTFNIPIPGK